jgi:hypothetical protein
MKLVIKRSEWLRGEGVKDSALLRTCDNKMCCLGFLAVSLDATKESIADKASPACVPTIKWPEGFVKPYPFLKKHNQYTNSDCCELMEINDATDLPEEEREAELTKYFKRAGIEVEFVD